MDKIRFQCISCGRKLGALPGREGKRVKCPDCGALQEVPGSPAGPATAAEPAGPPAPEAAKPQSHDDEPLRFADEPDEPAAGAAPAPGLGYEFAARETVEAEEFRYEAFISYRHVEPDRRWAKWLHTALETYRVPERLVKSRRLPARIRRIFRDEEELPASADLNKEIESALAQSRFLVVVCSPRTPESEWVNKEVLRFREMGRHDQILAILIEGEPVESFPRALREIRRTIVDAKGLARQQIEETEPLAADVRSIRGESKRYLKRMAKLRMLARILGVPFDDLRQREQERRFRRLALLGALAAVLVLAMAGLSAFALYQGFEAMQQRGIAAEKQKVAEEERQRADDERQRAEDQKKRAEDSAAQAIASAQKEREALVALKAKQENLTVAENAAQKEAKAAAEQARLAKEAAEMSEKTQYALRVKEALAAWAQGDGGRQEQLLGQCRPQDRGWEWEYIRRLGVTRLLTYKCRLDYGVAVSPDGTRVAVVGHSDEKKSMKVLDAVTGKEVCSLDAARIKRGGIRGVAFSPDGGRLALGCEDGVLILDATNGNLLQTLAHPEAFGVAFSKNGQLLASAANAWSPKGPASVKVWDARTYKPLLAFEPDSVAQHVAFSPDSGRLAAGMATGVRVWRLLAGRATLLFKTDANLEGIEFSPDGALLIGACHDKSVTIWDGVSGKVLSRLMCRSDPKDARFSPDGRVIAAAVDRDTVEFWDVVGARRLFTMPSPVPGATDILNRLAFFPDGRRLAVVDSNTFQVWDAGLPPAVRSINTKEREEIRAMAAAFDGRGVLSVTEYGRVTAWQPDADRSSSLFKASLGEAALSRDGSRLAVAGGGFGRAPTVVKVWTLEPVKELVSIPENDFYYFKGSAFSADGTRVAACGTAADQKTGLARVWDVATGKVEYSVPMARPAYSVAFSQDGRLLACQAYEQLQILDARSGQPVAKPLASSYSGDHPILFSPDGTRVAAGNRVFDAVTGKEVLRLIGDVLAFSPDGTRLVTALKGQDNSLVLWDGRTGQEVLRFQRECPPMAALFSPDGSCLFVGWKDGLIELRETGPSKDASDRGQGDHPATAPAAPNAQSKGAAPPAAPAEAKPRAKADAKPVREKEEPPPRESPRRRPARK